MTRQQADVVAGQFGAASDLARGLEREFSARELGEPPAAGAWSAAGSDA